MLVSKLCVTAVCNRVDMLLHFAPGSLKHILTLQIHARKVIFLASHKQLRYHVKTLANCKPFMITMILHFTTLRMEPKTKQLHVSGIGGLEHTPLTFYYIASVKVHTLT